MNARIRRTAAMDPALATAWEQLQVHYAAYQAIQDALTHAHPHRRIDVCNQLATLAEQLGVVDHAQLLGDRCADNVSQGRHAESTPQ